MPTKVWILEKKIEDEWYLEGTYSERFIPQMAAAYGELARSGLEPYKDIRIRVVDKSA